MIEVIFFDLGDTLATANRKWIPGAKSLLFFLKQKGARLGIISNTGDLARSQILDLLPPDFDLQIFDSELLMFSSEVGAEKPNPQIFNLALSKSGIDAGNCLFCTESLMDTLVAQQVGFKTVRLRPPPSTDIAGLGAGLVDSGLLIP